MKKNIEKPSEITTEPDRIKLASGCEVEMGDFKEIAAGKSDIGYDDNQNKPVVSKPVFPVSAEPAERGNRAATGAGSDKKRDPSPINRLTDMFKNFPKF